MHDCTSPIEEGQEGWVARAGQCTGRVVRVKSCSFSENPSSAFIGTASSAPKHSQIAVTEIKAPDCRQNRGFQQRRQTYFRGQRHPRLDLAAGTHHQRMEDLTDADPNHHGADPGNRILYFTFNLISSEFAFNSGAYIAQARVGKALNRPGVSARMR